MGSNATWNPFDKYSQWIFFVFFAVHEVLRNIFSFAFQSFARDSGRATEKYWCMNSLWSHLLFAPLYEKSHTGCFPASGPGLVPSLLMLEISLALKFVLLGTGTCLAMLLLLPVVQTKSGKRGKNHDTCYIHYSFTLIYKISSLVHYIHHVRCTFYGQ